MKEKRKQHCSCELHYYALRISGIPNGFQVNDFLTKNYSTDIYDNNYLLEGEHECIELANLTIDALFQEIKCWGINKICETATSLISELKKSIITGTERPHLPVKEEIKVESGHRILIFRTFEYRNRFFYESKRSILFWIFSTKYRYYFHQGVKYKIHIDICGEPKEIKWENFEYSSKNRYTRILISWSIIVITLSMGLWVNIILTQKMDYHNSHSNFEMKLYGIFCSIAIILNNCILSNLIYYSTR